MKVDKNAKDFKSLSKVVKKVDLKSIFLFNCKVCRRLNALEYPNVNINVTSQGILLEEKDGYIIAKATFSAKGSPEEEQEMEVASFESEYILTYSLEDKKELTTEDLERFCSINAIYNAWPYWREFLQNISNRMELPTFTLPLLKFRQAKKKEEG